MQLMFLDKNKKVLKNIFKILFLTRNIWNREKYEKYWFKIEKTEDIYHTPPHSMFWKENDSWHNKLNN